MHVVQFSLCTRPWRHDCSFGALERDRVTDLAALRTRSTLHPALPPGSYASASKATTMPRTVASSLVPAAVRNSTPWSKTKSLTGKMTGRRPWRGRPFRRDSWREGPSIGRVPGVGGDSGSPRPPWATCRTGGCPRAGGVRRASLTHQLGGKTEQLIDSSDDRFARYATAAPTLCASYAQPERSGVHPHDRRNRSVPLSDDVRVGRSVEIDSICSRH